MDFEGLPTAAAVVSLFRRTSSSTRCVNTPLCMGRSSGQDMPGLPSEPEEVAVSLGDSLSGCDVTGGVEDEAIFGALKLLEEEQRDE